ncbi:MAG: glycine zipper 2TM domain-containing protein [Methylococcaceae bacterium]
MKPTRTLNDHSKHVCVSATIHWSTKGNLEKPPVNYYPPNPRPNAYYDQRSPQGLIGGVVGSVLGYEIGNGNPIGAGLGAAVGSYMGSGW